VPIESAFTNPDVEPIVATDVVVLDHVPPPVALLSVEVLPIHKLTPPVMDAGDAFTVIDFIIWQPVPSM
jgi:hypothetical protein